MINRLLFVFAALVVSPALASFNAEQLSKDLHLAQLQVDVIQEMVAEAAPQRDLINWQIGDYHDIKIEIFAGMGGNGVKSVTKEEVVDGDRAIWYVTEMNIMGQVQKTESLIRRKDAKVLKLIVNGKEEDPNQGGEIEIIDQRETSITVPAGTFECMYIKAKLTGQQKGEVELWVNPIDVNLDGTLQMKMKAALPVTLKLKAFGRR